MWIKVRTFLFGLLYEGSEPSLTRLILAASFLVFIAVSLYICIYNVHWDNYSTFAYITGGGSIGGKVADKLFPNGSTGPKNGGN